jgi:hypothetical protein
MSGYACYVSLRKGYELTLVEHQNALPTSSALWWGEDFTFFYNQAYAEVSDTSVLCLTSSN